jgi:predicted ATP-grasp superfamily ATP-dependent carboligase
MSKILLTGGRAPATLDLARAFHRAGHIVFMAESLRGHLSEPSNAVARNFTVPAPRQQQGRFIESLREIIIQNRIDLLIPTCEEAFHVAMGRDRLPCRVFIEPIQQLNIVHNKWRFILKAVENDLSVPETILISNQDDLFHAYAQWRGVVLKPVYSRFAARTLIRPPLKKALATLRFDSPWIAQEHVDGQQICTYSICHNGHVAAHTAYPSKFTAGQGATVAFQHIHHPAIFDWVKKFVKVMQFTGQIAFDFIQTPDEQILALECNPRATSGVHLLANQPGFVDSFLNDPVDCVVPAGRASYMLSTAMLVYGLPASIVNGRFIEWLRTFLTSNDVILDGRDVRPFLLQFKSILHYLKLARQEKISPLEASTFDIEWNGAMRAP